jgi:hypothetical protein
MNLRFLSVAIIGLFGLTPCWADTITTKDHISINGTLVRMFQGEITVIARYTSEKKTLSIKVEQIEMIEFNATTFNASAPPKGLGLGPPLKPGSSAPSKPKQTDTIFLRGSHTNCHLIGIDEEFVHCAEKDGSFSRRVVLRIVMGAE